MSAKRKHENPDVEMTPEAVQESQATQLSPPTRFTEARADMDAEPTPSPARVLQEQLQEAVVREEPRRSVMDTGRVLAVSSGITAIMGVFIFSAMW